jgi:hypothetical protein
MNTEEWPKETKQKIILSTVVILAALLFFAFI